MEGVATVTTANEPVVPETVAGFSVMEAGWPCGVIVSCDVALAPFQLAVMWASVFAETEFVGTCATTVELPAWTVATAGASAAGESLLRSTCAPPAGANPFRVMNAAAVAPPLIVPGFTWIDLIEGGSTVIFNVVVPELSVAVTVTGVGVVTCPAWAWNCIHPVLPGMFTVAGTGNAFGSELVKLITAPFKGAAVESCNCTKVVLPLKIGLLTATIETGAGGAWLTVNVPLADQLVTAAVVGEASPCAERMRQNFCPGVSESSVRLAWFNCGASSSIVLKPESLAICNS